MELKSRKRAHEAQPDTVSRRTLLTGTVRTIVLGAATVLTGCATSYAQFFRRNIPKRAAHYQLHPNGRQHCAICVHFIPPDQCSVVAGRISPHGWCRYFSA